MENEVVCIEYAPHVLGYGVNNLSNDDIPWSGVSCKDIFKQGIVRLDDIAMNMMHLAIQLVNTCVSMYT